MTERLFLRLDGDPLYAPETGVPAGAMREHEVAAALRGHVAHLSSYRETIPEGRELLERIIPDGLVRLMFDPATASMRVAGASASPVLLRLRGHQEGITVSLRPGAAAAVLGLPAAELAEQAVALEELWSPAEARVAIERLAAARDDRARVAVFQTVLAARARAALAADPARRQAAHLAQAVLAGGGRARLRDVAASAGIGERRMQQLFHAHVGLSPRVWRRLARLHATLRALRALAAAPRWAELALDVGFYDQSHLANEFRALCGLPPSLFLAQAVAGSSKTPA